MNAVGKVTNGKFEEFANTKKGGSQDLSELTGRVATAEEDIDALETNVAQIDDVITAQGTAINNLDTRTTQQGESITSAEEILAQHGVTLDDLAEKVADILLHKISADKVLTAESESAYADDTFLMSGKKTASLIAQLNGNLIDARNYLYHRWIYYYNNTKTTALDQLNNPGKIFGNKYQPYLIMFQDTVGDSLLLGGIHLVIGYMYDSDLFGAQLVLSFGNCLRYRRKIDGNWTDLTDLAVVS